MNTINMLETSPFTLVRIISKKAFPEMRPLNGNCPRLYPQVQLGISIFIVDQSEFTLDLLIINNNRKRVMAKMVDEGAIMQYLSPLGLNGDDIENFARYRLEWDEMLRLLDKSRSFQVSPEALKRLLSTLDFSTHYPLADLDKPPIWLPDRVVDLLGGLPPSVIEIVMNGYDNDKLDDFLLSLVLKHNQIHGQALSRHYRMAITEYSPIDELIELFGQNYKSYIKHQLLILDIKLCPESKFWQTFISTFLIPYLDEVIQEGRVILLNWNKESLELKDVPVSVFMFYAGLKQMLFDTLI